MEIYNRNETKNIKLQGQTTAWNIDRMLCEVEHDIDNYQWNRRLVMIISEEF